jgi:hypothetical protein
MASTINASTTGAGGLITTADSSGILQLQTAGTTVATLSSTGVNAGIQVAANAAPAFSATMSATQTGIVANTDTKVSFDTKVIDTGTCYNNTASTVTLNGISTPAYSFAPNVAGYYQVNAGIRASATTQTQLTVAIYKNATVPNSFIFSYPAASGAQAFWISGSALVFMNGTSDYIYLAGNTSGTSGSFQNSASQHWFSASLVRGA